MKVFGKNIFTKKKVSELYDFAQHGLVGSDVAIIFDNLINVEEETPEESAERAKRKKAHRERPKITPKELYNLKSLNLPDMKLNCDLDYLDRESALLERKAKLILKKDSAKIRYGKEEVESLVLRLQNRKKYLEHKDFFEAYPYTTSVQIKQTVDGYNNLRVRRVEEFIPDLPSEAIDAMEQYNQRCRQLCGKTAVYYIIADKKDFEVQAAKRDPVLLAQSPFGLVWQILGAWDEEMVLLEEL